MLSKGVQNPPESRAKEPTENLGETQASVKNEDDPSQATSGKKTNESLYSPEHVQKIYLKQAGDMMKHCTWLLEQKYNQKCSTLFMEHVVSFYSKALDLNHLTENNPLDGLLALNYFVRLEHLSHESLAKMELSKREPYLYEMLVISINLANKMSIDGPPWLCQYASCLDKDYYTAHLNSLSKTENLSLDRSAIQNHYKHVVKDLKVKFDLDNFSSSVIHLFLSHKNKTDLPDYFIDRLHQVNHIEASHYLASNLSHNIKLLKKEAKKILTKEEIETLEKDLNPQNFKLALMAASMASKLDAKRPIIDKKYSVLVAEEVKLRKAMAFLKNKPKMMTAQLNLEKRATPRLVKMERQALVKLKYEMHIDAKDETLKTLYKALNSSWKESALFDPLSSCHYSTFGIEKEKGQEMLSLYKRKSTQALQVLAQLHCSPRETAAPSPVSSKKPSNL